MEGKPRRGRRRRQPQDQPPGQVQPAGSTSEQPPVPEEVSSPGLREEPAFTPQPSIVEEAVPPPSAAAEHVPSPTEQPLHPPAPAVGGPPQSAAVGPQALPSHQKRPDRPPQPHGKPEHPKGQRDHVRGEPARADQGRGDQNRGEQRRAQEAVLAALSALSPPIRADGEGRRIEDLLRGVRKALEDECMIGQEDASERVLLDLALSAIRDRVTIHRIQPVTRDLEETERLLRLRNQSDRHVVEMLTALKSA